MKSTLLFCLAIIVSFAGCGDEGAAKNESFVPLDLHLTQASQPGPGYSLMQVIYVYDEDALEDYLEKQTELLKEYEAELIVTGAGTEIVEGEFPEAVRNILIRWPDLRTFQDFYNSAEYRKILKNRRKAAFFNVVLFDGSTLREQLAQINRDSVYDNPAIVVMQIKEIGNMMKFVEYIKGHIPSMEQYGGKYLAEIDKVHIISGDFPEAHFHVLQVWPSKEAFLDWYNSEAYRPWRELRDKTLEINLAILAGPAVE